MGRIVTREERFAAHVDRSGGPESCWPWTGRLTPYGYGEFTTKSKGSRHRTGAHRVAYELFVGEIPEGMLVCHSCDNRPCCNPVHLWLGTNEDNMADMVAKGRQARGLRRPESKLTPDLVGLIRSSKTPERRLAAQLGVSRQAIGNARRRRSWKSVA